MTSSINIQSRYDLLALHRGLMEARFCEIANDRDVSGSPILARIHRDVMEALIAAEVEDGRDPATWFKWLALNVERREWAIALGRARGFSQWKGLTIEDKRKFVRDLLSPFQLHDELVERFIDEV